MKVAHEGGTMTSTQLRQLSEHLQGIQMEIEFERRANRPVDKALLLQWHQAYNEYLQRVNEWRATAIE